MKKIITLIILIAGFTLANSATISVTPSSPATLASSPSQDTLNVTSNGDWTATSNQSWCVIISGSSGSGNGRIIYTVTGNSTAANSYRVAQITATPSGGTAQVIYISQNTSFIAKKLKGSYFEIVSDTSVHIYTEEGILSLKTFPTNFYFGEIDSIMTVDIVQLATNGPCDLVFNFKLYWDYFSYWNWYNPYRLKVQPNSSQKMIGKFVIKQVDLSSQFAWSDSIDFWIKRGVANYFNISQSKILNFDY